MALQVREQLDETLKLAERRQEEFQTKAVSDMNGIRLEQKLAKQNFDKARTEVGRLGA